MNRMQERNHRHEAPKDCMDGPATCTRPSVQSLAGKTADELREVLGVLYRLRDAVCGPQPCNDGGDKSSPLTLQETVADLSAMVSQAYRLANELFNEIAGS